MAAPKPSAVDGIWLGQVINRDSEELWWVQIQIKSDTAGKEYCTFDSLDQDVIGIECANVAFTDNKFSSRDSGWPRAVERNSLRADGKTLNGTWTRAHLAALNFERQSTAITLPSMPPPVLRAQLWPPSTLAQLRSVLDRGSRRCLQERRVGSLHSSG